MFLKLLLSYLTQSILPVGVQIELENTAIIRSSKFPSAEELGVNPSCLETCR